MQNSSKPAGKTTLARNACFVAGTEETIEIIVLILLFFPQQQTSEQ